MRRKAEWAHKRGIHLQRYLDNWLILALTAEQARRDRNIVLNICKTLGILVNCNKLEFIPTQNIRYLGMMINTQTSKAFPSQERLDKFLDISNRFLSNLLQPKKNWQILIGHPVSLEKLVPRGRAHLHFLAMEFEGKGQGSEKIKGGLDFHYREEQTGSAVVVHLSQLAPKMLVFSDTS